MSTGDMKGCLRKLEFQLRLLRYPREVDYCGLAKGDPSCFLPIMSYSFISYSSSLTEQLIGLGIELAGKNEVRFLEAVYKVLRDVFHYKPLLTRQQFLQFGFAERKINILCDIIGFVMEKHKQLCKGLKPKIQKSFREPPEQRTEDFSPEAETLKFTRQPLVERHTVTSTPALCSNSGEEESETAEEELPEPQICQPSPAVPEERLQALEEQLQECQHKLGRLSVLEQRLHILQCDMAGKIIIDRQEWDNLEGRVLLLETKLALAEAQTMSRFIPVSDKSPERESAAEVTEAPELPQDRDFSTQHISETCSPQCLETSKENLKERLERIANMMKDTSRLLGAVEPVI